MHCVDNVEPCEQLYETLRAHALPQYMCACETRRPQLRLIPVSSYMQGAAVAPGTLRAAMKQT